MNEPVLPFLSPFALIHSTTAAAVVFPAAMEYFLSIEKEAGQA